MAITFSASSLDFGSVTVGSTSTKSLTITNGGSTAVTLTAPSAPFTWDAASTTLAAGGSVTVVITFTPTSVKSYTGSTTGDGVSCALAGTGLVATDEFESASDSTATDASSGSSGTAGTKYYEIMVPNFALNGSTATPGTSFLRIGNFNATPPTSTGSGLTGEGKSWQLANIVGSATAIAGAETLQDLNPDSYPTTPSYNGDPNYLLGFCDDTRYRQNDTTSTWTARRDETKKLLTKGGWWDHSDGNRISTTAGDKIEVIQGNYKMLVLGRVDSSSTAATLGANTLITDVSGGLMTENGPSPTHCIKSIEFSQNQNGTWEVYQNNGIGNVFSSFYGDTVDIFLGPRKATWTGTPVGYTSDDADDKVAYDVYKNSAAIREKLKETTSGENPAVLDHMYASRILDYKRVEGSIKSDIEANNIWSKTYAKPGSSGGGGQIQSDTIATTITSTTTAASITSTNFAANNFAFTFGIQEAINIGAILDVQLGPKSSINVDWMQFNGLSNVVNGQKNEANALKNKLNGLHNELVAYSTRVANTASDISTMFTGVAATTTTLAQMSTHVATAFDVLSTEISLV